MLGMLTVCPVAHPALDAQAGPLRIRGERNGTIKRLIRTRIRASIDILSALANSLLEFRDEDLANNIRHMPVRVSRPGASEEGDDADLVVRDKDDEGLVGVDAAGFTVRVHDAVRHRRVAELDAS